PVRSRETTTRRADRLEACSDSGAVIGGRMSVVPGPWRQASLLVQEHRDGPDLLRREEVLPRRHRRAPWSALAGQPGSALRDSPEHEALGELRDGAAALELEGRRIERVGVVSAAIERVAVAGQAVLVVDALAELEVL